MSDPLNYNERHEEERLLTNRGPASLADLKKQTDARRKRIADEYYKAQYERALKIQARTDLTIN